MQKDLPEGIRALLIDKDGAPNWSINSLDELSETDVEEYFTSPWKTEHPLSDL